MSDQVRGIAHGLPYVIEVDPDLVPEAATVRVAGTESGRIFRFPEGRWVIEYDPTPASYETMDDAAADICGMVASAQLAVAADDLIVRQNLERDAKWKRVLKAAERTITPETAHERGNHE
jgi:hypothetical protein